MARALLLVRGVRRRILATTAFALAACSNSNPGNVADTGKSPGTVTLRLNLPSTTSFCDQVGINCGTGHIWIATTAGQMLDVSPGLCAMICSSQCEVPPCTAGACLPGGLPITDAVFGWDGSYYEPSNCGNHCLNRRFVPAGRYVAHMCATPGTVSAGVDGGWSTCTASGPVACVDVPFDLPGPSPVEAMLP